MCIYMYIHIVVRICVCKCVYTYDIAIVKGSCRGDVKLILRFWGYYRTIQGFNRGHIDYTGGA